MMALKTRRLEDGENEQITIERLLPVFKGRNHLRPDYWTAEGRFDGILMRLTVLTEDRKLFVDAGYVPAEIFKHVVTTVNIDVITIKDDGNRWRIGEVVHRDESAPVHTDAERQADYLTDLHAYGGTFTRIGATELQFSVAGRWVNWSTDSKGRYVRLTATDRKLYARKGQS